MPVDAQLDRRRRGRRRHQQAAEELARDVAADRRRCRPARPLACTTTGGQPLPVSLTACAPKLIERVEQIADRPLAHPRDAIEPKRAMPERDERREKADRRAAVGAEQLGFQRGNPAARALRRPASARRRATRRRCPARPRPSIITRVSSLSSAPVSVEVPSASAAQTSARFVMLFDPGGRTRPRIGSGDGLNFQRIPSSSWRVRFSER